VGKRFKPMSFGEHLLRVLQFEESGHSKQKIKSLLESEATEVPNASMYDMACSDAIYWVALSDVWEADYLLECLNERYDRASVLDAVDTVTLQMDKATDNPLAFAFEQSLPIRLVILTIALVRNLSPGRDVKAAVRSFAIPPDDRPWNAITFPENLQRVFDLEELAGAEKESIPVLLDPLAWDLQNLEKVETPNVSSLSKACSEASDWVRRFTVYPEYDLRHHLIERYSVEQIIEASTAIEQNANVLGNPLLLAFQLPFPIRLTIVMHAIHRWYDGGGENVDVSSDLPPKPPAPGHWGGRTPGYEEPLPPSRRKDFDIGHRNVKR
jgi:hypothetical protein